MSFGRQSKKGRVRLAAAALITTLLGFTATASARPHSSKACPTTDTVRIMHVVSPDFAVIDLIHQLGIDAQYCLNLQHVITANAGSITAAVAAGQVEMGYANGGTIANAYSQGVNIKALLPAEVARSDNNGVFVKADSPIRTLKDLEGKTIGLIAVNATPHAAVIARLGGAGVDLSKVKMIGYPFPQMGAGILNGQIDAGQLTEPFLSQTKAMGAIRELFPTWTIFGKHAALVYYIANGSWVKSNPDLVRRVQQALAKGLLAAIRNPTALTQLVVNQDPKLTPDVVAKQIPPLMSLDVQVNSLHQELQRMVKLKMLPSEPNYYDLFLKPTASSGNDILTGLNGPDAINGLGGNDIIFGWEGNDKLNGGPGNDILDGGPGRDTIQGGPGNDTIIATDGYRDVIDCGPGRDTAYVDKQDVVKNCEVVKYSTPTKLLASLGWGA